MVENMQRTLRLLVFVSFALFAQPVFSQSSVDDSIQGITTLVISSTGTRQSMGTAFFYHQRGASIPTTDGNGWRVKIDKLWLVTNRHVLVPRINGKEEFPTTFTFHLRKTEGNTLNWEPITLTKDDLLKRARFHIDLYFPVFDR